MSELTEVKTSIKRISSILDETDGLSKDSLPKLKDFPLKLLSLVEQFEDAKNTNLKTIENNSDEINNLKNTISQNKRDITKLEEDNNISTKNRQELTEKIQSVQNKIKELEGQISTKKTEIENRSKRLQELENNIQELSSVQEQFEEKMIQTEEQLKSEFDKKNGFVNSFENRVKAMKLLIKKNYIRSPQVQLIQALQKDTALDLNNIIQALDIKMSTATNIIKKIIQLNGPIEFDEGTNKITLKSEVDFKI